MSKFIVFVYMSGGGESDVQEIPVASFDDRNSANLLEKKIDTIIDLINKGRSKQSANKKRAAGNVVTALTGDDSNYYQPLHAFVTEIDGKEFESDLDDAFKEFDSTK